jgi:hypothetical protein
MATIKKYNLAIDAILEYAARHNQLQEQFMNAQAALITAQAAFATADSNLLEAKAHLAVLMNEANTMISSMIADQSPLS